MTPPIFRHDDTAPATPAAQDNRKALLLAILVHVLLVLALVLGVNWRSENPGPVQVELWAAGDAPDSPPPREPPDEPRPEPKPEPKPEPQPEPRPAVEPPQPDPEIALEAERKRREQEEQARQQAEAAREAARLEAERKQAELKEKQRLEQERMAAEKAAAEKAAAEKAAAEKAAAEKAAAEKAAQEKAEAERKAAAEKKAREEAARKAAADQALRDAFRNDALGAAGIPGGTADRNQQGGGRDEGYGAKVRACVRPGVAYPTPARSGPANPTAQYRVQLSSDGRVTSVTLISSSGDSGFDRSVETGIRRCNPFPKPSTGRYESVIDVVYRMYD